MAFIKRLIRIIIETPRAGDLCTHERTNTEGETSNTSQEITEAERFNIDERTSLMWSQVKFEERIMVKYLKLLAVERPTGR